MNWPHPIEAVLFDMDGTLLDSEHLTDTAVAHLLKAHDLDLEVGMHSFNLTRHDAYVVGLARFLLARPNILLINDTKVFGPGCVVFDALRNYVTHDLLPDDGPDEDRKPRAIFIKVYDTSETDVALSVDGAGALVTAPSPSRAPS